MAEYARGNDTSYELTEARTVLSRAETALLLLERHRARDGRSLDQWEINVQLRDGTFTDGLFHADPDTNAIITILEETVRQLDKYRRTGKTKRRR